MSFLPSTLKAAVGLSLAVLFSPVASAQEILPFPPTPSASTAALTMTGLRLQEARRAEAPR